MSVARVNVFTFFPQVTAAIEERTRRALAEAARAGKAVAEERAGDVARFETIAVHDIGDGYASGVHAGPLARIYDKGSLGKRTAALKKSRKPSWEVNRGANPYLARRSEDLSGKGVAPRRIISAARAAGRKALIAGIRGH